jgi:hypothetical protein
VSSKNQIDFNAPHEIIANGKWERALFTTYALSLTFFETHILKAGLIRNGCHTIWVVADVDGYQQSLSERQSARVGQEYHLIPVALPNGVFHPKCVYLSGPEGDVLLVGSGNLTFGGFGRNVEVLEVLTSAEFPWLFRAFGEYLEALNSRKDFLNPDPRWIKIFSELAYKAAKNSESEPDDGPHLIHCVQSSVAGQLADFFAAAGGAARLRILSPFYDPDAAAVRELAAKAGCQRVTIGLLPGQENESTFPFNTEIAKDTKLEAAVLTTKKDGRTLHAKWLEADLNDARRLTLTGSVNATRKSLCSTDNIEVGLVRFQSNRAAKYLDWEQVDLPKHFERRQFSKAGLGSRWVIHARFTRETLLEGKLIGSSEPDGKWDAFLARPDGERVEFDVNVNGDGSFRVPVPHAEHYATTTAVQITLRRGQNEAVGWLHMEGILNLPRLPRLGVTSLMRLVNNEQTEDDDAALLEYLALSAQSHLLTFRLEVKPRVRHDEKAHDNGDHNLRVNLERLIPASTGQEVNPAQSLTPNSERYLDEIFERLRRRMLTSLGATASHGITSSTTDETKLADDGSADEDEAQPKKVTAGLDRFEETMRSLAAGSGQQDYLKAVFNMWLEVGLLMRIERLKDIEAAEFFCRKWVHDAVQRCKKESGIATFDRHLITITVTLAANTIAEDNADEAASLLVQLHEDLERYCGGPVPADFAMGALVTEAGMVISDRLRLTRTVGLVEALNRLLSTRTFREEINLIRARSNGQPLPTDLQILKTPSGKILAGIIARNSKLELFEFKLDRNSCPKCHMEINLSVRNELSNYRISRCLHCGRFIINLN